MCAQWYDACIVLPGCDKNMPGSLMALGRLNRPGFMVYGGTIRAGHTVDGRADRHRLRVHLLRRPAGGQDDRRRAARSRAPCLSRRRRLRRHVHRQHDGLRDRSDGHVAAVQLVAAGDRSRTRSTSAAARATAIRNCMEKDIKPRDVMTREAFENAMAWSWPSAARRTP